MVPVSSHESASSLPCAEHLSDDVKRRFYKNYFKSKKKAFTKYAAKYADGGKAIEAELEAMKKNATVVRVLAHTQIRKVANWGQKKPHVLEIQVRRWHFHYPAVLPHDTLQRQKGNTVSCAQHIRSQWQLYDRMFHREEHSSQDSVSLV